MDGRKWRGKGGRGDGQWRQVCGGEKWMGCSGEEQRNDGLRWKRGEQGKESDWGRPGSEEEPFAVEGQISTGEVSVGSQEKMKIKTKEWRINRMATEERKQK